LAFHNFSLEHTDLDEFSRKVYFFGELKKPYEKSKRSIPVDKLLRIASKKAEIETNSISESGSRNRGAIYFILAATSIWLGVMGGCKEIVTEKHIIKRELRSCVKLTPFLFSKVMLLVLIGSCQTAILSIIVGLMLLNISLWSAVKLWLILWIAYITAANLGLCLSCFSPTYRFALTIVPLLLIFQLIFGGMIRPLANLENISDWPEIMGCITIQRWAFEAAIGIDTYGQQNVLKHLIDSNKDRIKRKYANLNIIQYTNSSLRKTFFRFKERGPFLFPICILFIFNIFFLLACHWRLKKICSI
jgi:hypothetical protein